MGNSICVVTISLVSRLSFHTSSCHSILTCHFDNNGASIFHASAPRNEQSNFNYLTKHFKALLAFHCKGD